MQRMWGETLQVEGKSGRKNELVVQRQEEIQCSCTGTQCPQWSLVSEAGARSHESPTDHSKLFKNNVRFFVRDNLVRALVIAW